MNSQIVLINQGLKAKRTFIVLTSLIPISLFLKAGFISVSVIWFFALCLYSYDPSAKRRLRDEYVLLLPVLLFFINLVWIFFSNDVATAIDLTLRKIHLLLIPLGFFVVNKRVTDKDMHILLFIFMAGCVLCSLVCYARAISSMIALGRLTLDTGSDNYLFSGYWLTRTVNLEPVYLSLYCNLAFLTAIKTPLLKSNALKAVIALYLTFFIIMIGSKIGIICMLVITIAWLLTTSYKRLSLLLLCLFVLAGVIASYNSSYLKERVLASAKFRYTDANGNLINETADYFVIWKSAIETVKANPVVGYGTADGQTALEEAYKRNGFDLGVRDALNPHNEFFSSALDLGIIGAIAMAAILIVPLTKSIKAKDAISVGFVILIGLYCCVESVLLRQKGIVFFAFFSSILSGSLHFRLQEASAAQGSSTDPATDGS